MKKITKRYLFFLLLGLAFACKKDDATPVPTVNFVFAPVNPTTLTEVSFTATVLNATTYVWSSVPIGFSSTVQNPKYTFAVAGTYAITLVATGDGGSTLLTKSITIATPKPNVGFTFTPTSATVGQTVTFTATAQDATIFAWSSVPAGLVATVQNPTYKFATAGNYQVTLKATGAGGDTTLTKSIAVTASLLKANFTFAPTSPLTGQSVAFTNTSTSATTSAWSSIPAGFTSTLASPMNTFTTENTFKVKLVVKDEFGNSDSTTKDVIVSKPIVLVTLPSTLSDTITTKINGSFQTIKIKAEQKGTVNSTTNIDISTGMALLYTAPSAFTFLDGGSVAINSQNLTKNANNSYMAISLVDGFVVKGTNINWSVVGNANVPAIAFNTNKSVPEMPQVVAFPNTLDKTTGFTIQISAPVTADILFVSVSGINALGTSGGKMTKNFQINGTSLTFTAADIANIDATKGFIITVNAINYVFKDFGGKIFLFSNLSTNSFTFTQ